LWVILGGRWASLDYYDLVVALFEIRRFFDEIAAAGVKERSLGGVGRI
jgi:hypothetical protein